MPFPVDGFPSWSCVRRLLAAGLLVACLALGGAAVTDGWAEPPRIQQDEVVAEGTFVGKAGHSTSGTFRIERSSSDDLTLIFEDDFETTSGPDLHVILSPHAVDDLTSDNANGNGALVVDSLHSDEGHQVYDLRDNLKVDDYASVVIYCIEFSALFGAAELNTSVVPVELTRFAAQTRNESVHLTWETASEQNNTGFRVQRQVGPEDGHRARDVSRDGWQTLHFVEGAGTTSERQSYTFVDCSVPYAADVLSYRLVQVDADGTTHPSEHVTVNRKPQDAVRLRAPFPNPASGEVTVRYAVPRAGGRKEGHLALYDVRGRRVKVLVDALSAGRYVRPVSTDGLASGTYFLRLTSGAVSRTRRISVVR